MHATTGSPCRPARRRSTIALLVGAVAIVTSLVTFAGPSQAATTEITVCSKNGTYDYNILGDNATSLRSKLDNPANFGPTGAYGDYDFTYTDLGDGLTVQKLTDSSCDIFFSGYEPDGSYQSSELQALNTWVTNDPTRQVVAGCDGSSNDPVCDLLGFTVTTDTDTYGFIADASATNPINCNASISPTDQINMAGGVGGYFSGAAVTAGNTSALHETGGVADPTKPIVVYTGNYFLTADINMIETGDTEDTVSDGPGVTTVNDRLAMNAFSALADVSNGVDICSSAAPPTTTTSTSTTTTAEPSVKATPVAATPSFTG